jgi:cytochrome P450 family 103
MSVDVDVKELPASGNQSDLPQSDLPLLPLQELDADPHGTFRRYRKDHAVVRHESGAYFVLRLADIEQCSKDRRLIGSETAVAEINGFEQGVMFDFFRYGMLTANGEVHRRRRAPFTKLFAARAIAEMRPRIRQVVEDIIDGWYDAGEVDFIEGFAGPLPARLIADLFALPKEDIPTFTRAAYEVIKVFTYGMPPDEIARVEQAGQHLRDYVARMLDDRRRNPGNDFLSAFLAAADEAGEMSPEEIVFQVLQLILGATDTTRVSTVMQVALLLQHRDQWEAVCREPALIPGAVAEALRFEPSTSGTARIATEDVELHGTIIPAGSLMALSALSAMRDERAFERPDTFDIGRSDQVRLHPVFGHGVHRCIGEALARAELEESLAALTARIPQLQLDVAPTISGHTGVRRIDAMRVSWKP